MSTEPSDAHAPNSGAPTSGAPTFDAPTFDAAAFESAVRAAEESLSEGGIPIGAALARGSEVIASGHNERVQHGDPIAHGGDVGAPGRGAAEELP
jgi:cytosine/creatinine deaminase